MSYLDSRQLTSTIIRLLRRSIEFDVAVAYSTGSLPRKLIRALGNFLRDNGTFKFLVGIQRNTDGRTLEQLYRLRGPGLDMRCTKEGNFHPKMYLFKSNGGTWTAVIGSSNFSRAGLDTNVESNLLIRKTGTVAKIKSEFEGMFNSNSVGQVDWDVIGTLKAMKRPRDKKRQGKINKLILSKAREPRFYFANMIDEQVNPYLRSGKYYASPTGFRKCRIDSIKPGDVVILRSIREVVGISKITGIKRLRAREERDVRDRNSFRPQGTYVLYYEPIRGPSPQDDGPFRREGTWRSNRFGQRARALQGAVVGANQTIARRYLRWYRIIAPRATILPLTLA